MKNVLMRTVCVLAVLSVGRMSFNCMADGVAQHHPVPIGVAIWEDVQFPGAETNVMGCRLCMPYGRQASVSGLDLGIIGCSVDGSLFGLQACSIVNWVGSSNGALQMSGIVNNCREDLRGVQMSGIANKTTGDVYGGQLSSLNFAKEVGGLQVGIFSSAEGIFGGQLSGLNFAMNVGGTQIGLFNKGDQTIGIQIGVINWATDLTGFQLGVLNYIKSGKYPVMPPVNMNF